jgi:hypothetical protein
MIKHGQRIVTPPIDGAIGVRVGVAESGAVDDNHAHAVLVQYGMRWYLYVRPG